MTRRTRHELIEFLCLVLSIPTRTATSHASAEAVAAATGVDVELVRRVEDCGLLRSEPSAPGRGYDADDAQVVAIIAELLDLGATDEIVEAYGRHLTTRCIDCASAPCPTRCDAVDVLRRMLAEMGTDARADPRRQVRAARIARAITSTDALSDLV